MDRITSTATQTHDNRSYAQPTTSTTDTVDSNSRTILLIADDADNTTPINNEKDENDFILKLIDRSISEMESCKNRFSDGKLIFAATYKPNMFTRKDFSRIYYATAKNNDCRYGATKALRSLAKQQPDIASADIKHFMELIDSPEGMLQLAGEMTWAFLPTDISKLLTDVIDESDNSTTSIKTLIEIVQRRVDLLQYAVWELEFIEKEMHKDMKMTKAIRSKKTAQISKIWSTVDSVIKQIKAQH